MRVMWPGRVKMCTREGNSVNESDDVARQEAVSTVDIREGQGRQQLPFEAAVATSVGKAVMKELVF